MDFKDWIELSENKRKIKIKVRPVHNDKVDSWLKEVDNLKKSFDILKELINKHKNDKKPESVKEKPIKKEEKPKKVEVKKEEPEEENKIEKKK